MYGGTINSASVIGKFGNPYQDYTAAFGLPLPNKALNLIPVTGNTSITAPVPSGYGSNVPSSIAITGPAICEICKSRKVELDHTSAQRSPHSTRYPIAQTQSQHQRNTSTMTKLIRSGEAANRGVGTIKSRLNRTDEESFMDVMKTVATALPTGLGLIGGGPIGALAGFALNAASQITAETTSTESVMDGQTMHEGSMERAILAEATLSVLQSREMHPQLEESIFSDMKDSVMKALPIIRKAAPRVMGAMMEPALKIALDSLHNYNQKVATGAESFEATSPEPFRPNIRYTSAIDQPGDHQAEAFLSHLQASMQHNLQESAMDGDSEEGFFDIIKAGARFAGQGVLAAAKHGLPILSDLLSAEAFEDQSGPGSGPNSHLLAADPLAQRALVADAALKAVMKLPPQQLEEEGFFDFISDAVKIIAPIAMKVVPVVAGAIHPTIGKVVSSVLKQESFSGESTDRGSDRLALRPGLSSKRSLYSLRNGDTNGNQRRNRFEQSGEANGSPYGGYTRLGSHHAYS